MPQLFDEIRFTNDGRDNSTYPRLSSPGANLLALGNGDLRLDAGRRLVSPSDAPLSVAGALIVSTGPTPHERLRIQPDGTVSISGDLSVTGLINGSDVAALKRQVDAMQKQLDALQHPTHRTVTISQGESTQPVLVGDQPRSFRP